MHTIAILWSQIAALPLRFWLRLSLIIFGTPLLEIDFTAVRLDPGCL